MWFGTRPRSRFICQKVPRVVGGASADWAGLCFPKRPRPLHTLGPMQSSSVPWHFPEHFVRNLRSVHECLWVCRIEWRVRLCWTSQPRKQEPQSFRMQAINLDTFSLSLLTAKEDILNSRASTDWYSVILLGSLIHTHTPSYPSYTVKNNTCVIQFSVKFFNTALLVCKILLSYFFFFFISSFRTAQ